MNTPARKTARPQIGMDVQLAFPATIEATVSNEDGSIGDGIDILVAADHQTIARVPLRFVVRNGVAFDCEDGDTAAARALWIKELRALADSIDGGAQP